MTANNNPSQPAGEAGAPPEELFVHVLRDGSTVSYGRDPRETYNNGKPVYVYRLQPAGAPSDTQAKNNDYNVTRWHKCFERRAMTTPYSDEKPLLDEIKYAARIIDLLYREVQSLRLLATPPDVAERARRLADRIIFRLGESDLRPLVDRTLYVIESATVTERALIRTALADIIAAEFGGGNNQSD